VAPHARNDVRAADVKKAAPQAEAVVVGDFSTIEAVKHVARQANALGPFDAVIHKRRCRVQGRRSRHQRRTAACVRHQHARPYVLTALIEQPKRLVYLSSGMHERAQPNLDDILWRKRRWDGSAAYAESKLHDVMLAFAVARLWPNVLSNAVAPG
jgi:hypothetical protein